MVAQRYEALGRAAEATWPTFILPSSPDQGDRMMVLALLSWTVSRLEERGIEVTIQPYDSKRDWIAGLKLPAAAREQLTIALEMIDAIEIQLGPPGSCAARLLPHTGIRRSVRRPGSLPVEAWRCPR
jgi:hypothetical protein